MNTSIAKFLKIAIPLGLGIFLMWYMYSRFTPEQLNEVTYHFKSANYWFVILSVLLSVLSHLSRAYRWNFMLEPLGFKPKLANSFMAVSVAYLMNIFIPKSGEVSRGIIFDKYEGIPFEKGFGTIISERVIDLLFLVGFTTIALMMEYDVLFDYVFGQEIPVKLFYLIGILVGLGILFLVFLKYSKSKLSSKLRSFILGLKEGILSIISMKKKGAFIFHSFLIWGLYILSFYTALFALEETSTVSFGIILITFVVGSFSFAFTNSGFGTYPVAIAAILMVFGVPETVGTAFGWIVWTSNITALLFFGCLSLIFLPLYNRPKQ